MGRPEPASSLSASGGFLTSPPDPQLRHVKVWAGVREAVRRAPEVRLLRGERARLTAMAASAATPPRLARRARMVLRAGAGATDRAIAAELGTDPGTVAKWRRRFLRQRLPGIEREAPRPGRPPTIPEAKIQVILRSTLGRRPAHGGFWSARTLAREVGVSKTTVQRVWRAHQIEPRRAQETFRPRATEGFVDKITDFVGLYLDPPERAMVFSVDPKGRASGLAPRERRAVAAYAERRRGLEFRAFLQAVDRETPKGFDLHLLVDSRLAPSDPIVRRWLVRHPRFFLHYVPSGSGGPNVIERWFGQFTRTRPGGPAYPSAARLRQAVRDHLATPGASGRPFVWTATAEEIRDRFGRTAAEARTAVPGRPPSPERRRPPDRPG